MDRPQIAFRYPPRMFRTEHAAQKFRRLLKDRLRSRFLITAEVSPSLGMSRVEVGGSFSEGHCAVALLVEEIVQDVLDRHFIWFAPAPSRYPASLGRRLRR